MDIRKYFGGGSKTQVKGGNSSASSNNNSSVKSKSKPAPKTIRSDSKKAKRGEVIVVDSDSNDTPIKVKHKNIEKKAIKDNSKEKVSITKAEKKKSGVKETKPQERNLPAAEGSPGEKENKEQERKSDKSKKDDKPKNGDKKESRDVSKDRKETSKKETPKKEASNNKNDGKRKASNVIESSDEEDIQLKVKSKTGKARKGLRIFDSDSDEDPLPRAQRGSSIKKRRPSTFVSDSGSRFQLSVGSRRRVYDDEKQMSIETAFKKVVVKKSPKKVVNKKSPVKTCSVSDFFGATPVHRVERKLTSVKRKADSSPAKDDLFDDMEMHDDEEFERTLLQIDTQQHTPKKVKLDDSEASSSGTSLSRKLASKIKAEETIVKETPESKKSPLKRDIRVIKETPQFSRSKSKVSPAKRQSPAEKIKYSPKKSPEAKKYTPKAAEVSAKKNSPLKTTPEKTPSSEEKPKLNRGTPSFRNYLQRAGPQALGSKEIPEGAPNCLEGFTFVLTGVYESIERDDCKALVERLGGKVTTSLSKKTNYIVIGRDAGVSKTAKAETLGTKQLDEDGLFDLIRNSKGKKSKYEIAAEAAIAKEKQHTPKGTAKRNSVSASPARSLPGSSFSSRSPSQASPSPAGRSPVITKPIKDSDGEDSGLMWVDKYKPKSLKQVIGQQGPKSNANKLLFWLKNWHKWVAEGRKPAFNSRFGGDDGAGFRAALLSGPPGVGKTTTATLVCQEAGFSYVELNASDTRSKKSLETEVAELLGNHTLVDFFGGVPKSQNPNAHEGRTHCLIMDEVDGMAGNADRGGMAELIQLIKKSKIPIICMCNDRNHQKVRSLSNYCFDLRFQRPRVEQIKAAMMSLAFKEGVKIPPPALNEMISAANQDVRQVIHNLCMWTASDKAPTYDQVKSDAAKATKDMKLGPFDVCRKVFVGGEETAKMSIHDKTDLFFQDYSFGPLFVHENYLHAVPYAARGDKRKHLACISKAIDSISDGDMIDRLVRRNQNWSLLPTEAMFASVIPGEVMRGGFGTMVQFPQWLGKNSSTNKTERILQELGMHMSLKISADKRSLNLDYVPFFRNALTKPLVEKQQEGVPEVMEILDEYTLLREDYDNILEISQWSNRRDPLSNVESKTKAAFTRAYNKESHLQPYAPVVTAKKGRGRGGGGGGGDMNPFGEEEEGGAEEEEKSDDDDPTKDAMIKPKKKPGKAAAAKGKSSKDKGEGKGRGRGAGSARGTGRGRGRGKKS